MTDFDPSIRNIEDYRRVYDYSLKNPDHFWDSVARKKISWRKPWDRTSNWNFNTAEISWYLGGSLNVSENCLDRHIKNGLARKPALIWVGNDPNEERVYSFEELHREVCRAANAFESLGVKKGDRVAFYLPNIPELAIGVLACARIGAVHGIIFGGFSAQSIRDRVDNSGATLIVTANGAMRGTKLIPLKATVNEALSMGCATVKNILVVQRLTQAAIVNQPEVNNIDVSWEDVMKSADAEHVAPAHDSEDPLFVLYTSGSTGNPKGVLHTMGGYITYAAYSHEIVFKAKEDHVYWCTADLGWITGHTYLIYGPLANGTTTVMFEGIPTHPTPSRFWEVVDRHAVSIFYSAPTAIRLLACAGNQFVTSTSRKSLRTLGTVGEPINPEAWKWYSSIVGEDRAPIVDTWWQTETGGILISPLAGITPTEPGSATFPLPGIEPLILDENAKPQTGEAMGPLVLARSWPGQMRGVYGDPKRFHKTYFTQFKGYYFTGDGARRDTRGNYWITGRMDDVIKVSGHRIGTAEIESACITHKSVAESGAIGAPDPITGEAIHVFVVLKDSVKPTLELEKEIVQIVRKEVGPLATPKKIYWSPGLPKTRSGKIMRRILKKIAQGQYTDLGDTTTLAEPQIVEKIIEAHRAAQVLPTTVTHINVLKK